MTYWAGGTMGQFFPPVCLVSASESGQWVRHSELYFLIKPLCMLHSLKLALRNLSCGRVRVELLDQPQIGYY